MAVIARCGHCNLPVLDSENRIFDGEQMYHQAHYAEAMRNQRDATREQLRGAVEALRRIAANDPMDPTPQEAAERALDDLGLSHFGEQ